MAKDGTMRGGARPGAGRPSKIRELPTPAALEGQDMPKPESYLKARESDGQPMGAGEIYADALAWLTGRGYADAVNPQLLERYSAAMARWRQCNEALDEYGFISEHPTTGKATSSPYVGMMDIFYKQAQTSWSEIVRACETYSPTGELSALERSREDRMETLLKRRKG